MHLRISERARQQIGGQSDQGGSLMTFQNPRPEIYDPKTLAVMDQAFAAIWNVLRADDPFRDYAKDSELRIAIGHKLMELVANGVTDPIRLGYLTLKSLNTAFRCPRLATNARMEGSEATMTDDARPPARH
jgi:hypothetical protein